MEGFVKEQLEEFLKTCHSTCDASCIDDTVLHYIISILNELACGGGDCIDVEQLEELLLAYIPTVNEINRFSYTEDTKERQFHPVLKQQEQKKMVRYRDNVVVSTKGERFTVESNKDRDNDEMKKTYINLKPLRKYRFH